MDDDDDEGLAWGGDDVACALGVEGADVSSGGLILKRILGVEVGVLSAVEGVVVVGASLLDKLSVNLGNFFLVDDDDEEDCCCCCCCDGSCPAESDANEMGVSVLVLLLKVGVVVVGVVVGVDVVGVETVVVVMVLVVVAVVVTGGDPNSSTLDCLRLYCPPAKLANMDPDVDREG